MLFLRAAHNETKLLSKHWQSLAAVLMVCCVVGGCATQPPSAHTVAPAATVQSDTADEAAAQEQLPVADQRTVSTTPDSTGQVGTPVQPDPSSEIFQSEPPGVVGSSPTLVTTTSPNQVGALWLEGVVRGMPVVPVGVDEEQSMIIPAKPSVLGWYQHGPDPLSAQGSAVFSAHVDSKKYGIGPLARLKDVPIGSAVTVQWGAHQTAYRVVRIDTYQKTELPAAELFSRTGPHRLTIITCGGTFDRKKGHYDENIVVTAEKL